VSVFMEIKAKNKEIRHIILSKMEKAIFL